jgi:hypothetical protein
LEELYLFLNKFLLLRIEPKVPRSLCILRIEPKVPRSLSFSKKSN